MARPVPASFQATVSTPDRQVAVTPVGAGGTIASQVSETDAESEDHVLLTWALTTTA